VINQSASFLNIQSFDHAAILIDLPFPLPSVPVDARKRSFSVNSAFVVVSSVADEDVLGLSATVRFQGIQEVKDDKVEER